MMRTFVRLLALAGPLLACSESSPPSDELSETGETGEEVDLSCESKFDCVDGLCIDGLCEFVEGRRPYRDLWREEQVLVASQFERLIIGGTATSDNFINRGDIEIRYVRSW